MTEDREIIEYNIVIDQTINYCTNYHTKKQNNLIKQIELELTCEMGTKEPEIMLPPFIIMG